MKKPTLKTYFMTKEYLNSYTAYVQASSEEEAKNLFLEIPDWECDGDGTRPEITSVSEKDYEEDFTDEYFPIFRAAPGDTPYFYIKR